MYKEIVFVRGFEKSSRVKDENLEFKFGERYEILDISLKQTCCLHRIC